jgi:hypothetical protein
VTRMEEWRFPAAYDQSYLPDPGSPYWFPHRETMDPAERDAAVLVRLREVMEYAYATSSFYRDKWDAVDLKPADITSFEAFEQVPVVTKAEMRASQADHPPFGDYLCCDESEIHHIHGTSGTTGAPTAFAIGRREPLPRVMGRPGRRRAVALPRAALRSRRPGHDRPGCHLARADEARGVLRHAVLRAAPG